MKALLIGAAVSGRAALGLLEADGFEVVVYDADPAAVADLGAERQVKQKAAGARTLALICVGSTLFTFASIFLIMF